LSKIVVVLARNATGVCRLLRRTGPAACLLVAADSGIALAQSSLPVPTRTPGAINADVMQETIATTICVRRWTATVRPPEEYTEDLKRRQIAAFGYADRRMRSYTEDHLVPLSLGGASYDRRNLWPEPRMADDGWTSHMKDELEAVLPRRRRAFAGRGAARNRDRLAAGISALCLAVITNTDPVLQTADDGSRVVVAFSTSWRAFADVKLNFFEAAIVSGSPVAGFRP
jgi:hypothetical protein